MTFFVFWFGSFQPSNSNRECLVCWTSGV